LWIENVFLMAIRTIHTGVAGVVIVVVGGDGGK